VWRVSNKGTEAVLHSFGSEGASDGAYPYAGVIMDAKGDLYGDTNEGGASGVGTVYELNKKGRLTLLHSFAGWDGAYPMGGLIRDAEGNLYGTTWEGSSGHGCFEGCGTVWAITKQ